MTIEAAQFQELMDEKLSGAIFVRDYVQLQFNPPCILSAFTPAAVSLGLEISMRPEHFKGPEALTFRRQDGRLLVIREEAI